MNLRLPLLAPVPVTDVRDVWDWLIIWCTITAVVIGIVTIVLSIRADCRNAREQRNASELGILIHVIAVCGHNSAGSLQVLQGLLMMLPEWELPGIRNEVKHGRVPSNDALVPFMAEYHVAVTRRLKGR